MILVSRMAYDEAEKNLEGLRATLDRVRQKKGVSGGGQDAWHDEQFKLAYQEESRILSDIMAKERQLADLEIVDTPKDIRVVAIGTIVGLRFRNKGGVSHHYFDGISVNLNGTPSITANSPLGSAIVGKRAGEKVSYKVKGRTMNVTITEIRLSGQ